MTELSTSFRYRKPLLIIVAIAAAVGGGWHLISSSPQAKAPEDWRRAFRQPAVVSAQPASLGNLNLQIKSIGTVTPLNTVTVRSRVNGVLEELAFEEGAEIKKGTLLALIDPLPYQAQLEQAEGQLQQNQAKLDNARTDLALYETLWQQDSIARQQLSDQRALVNELQGTLRANQAQVEDARLQLSWTRIEAPISGKLGLRKVDQGNLLTSGDSEGIVTITQLQPIAVNFTVPEVDVPALRRAFGGDKKLTVEVFDRSEQQILASGVLTTLDNQIDLSTGTLRVRAHFDNTDNALFPNQFVNVQLRLSTLKSVVTVPSDAVQYGTDRSYVYVIEDNKSYLREVTLSASSDNQVAINSGLEAGEMIVLEGLDRLRDGRDVTVNPATGDTAASVRETIKQNTADQPPRGRPEGERRGPPPGEDRRAPRGAS